MKKQQQYEIEQILAAQFSKPANRYYYLVKWVNWQVQYSTWQPEQNLYNAQEAIDQFEQKQKNNQIYFQWQKIQKLKQIWENINTITKNNKKFVKESKKNIKNKKIQKQSTIKNKNKCNNKQKSMKISKDKGKQLEKEEEEVQIIYLQESSMIDKNNASVNIMAYSSTVGCFPLDRNQSKTVINPIQKQPPIQPLKQNPIPITTKTNTNPQQEMPIANKTAIQPQPLKSPKIENIKQGYHRSHIILDEQQDYQQKIIPNYIRQEQPQSNNDDNLDKQPICRQNQQQNINEQNLGYIQYCQQYNQLQQDRAGCYNFMQSSQNSNNNYDIFQCFKRSQDNNQSNGQNLSINFSLFNYNMQQQQLYINNINNNQITNNNNNSIPYAQKQRQTSNHQQITKQPQQQQIQVLGIKRTGIDNSGQFLKYLIRDNDTKITEWKTKKQIVQLAPIALINFYQQHMLFNNKKIKPQY